MALVNPQSSVVRIQNGDFSTEGGQLGFAFEAALLANANLWDIYQGANRYLLSTPDKSSLTISLPKVSTVLQDLGCIQGHTIWITNTGNARFNINNASNVFIGFLDPLTSINLNATTNITSNWRIIGKTSTNLLVPADYADTMQSSYNNGNGITVDRKGGVFISDIKDGLKDNVFRVTNSTHSAEYFDVISTANNLPSISGLNAKVTGDNSFAVGPRVSCSGSNSVIFADGNLGTYNLSDSNTAYFGYKVFRQTSGPSIIGTPDSDVVYTRILRKVSKVPYDKPINVKVLIGLKKRTLYSYAIEVVAIDDGSSTSSVVRKIEGLCQIGSNNLLLDSLGQFPTPAKKTDYSKFILSFDADGDLSASISSPNTGSAANLTTMTFAVNMQITIYSGL